MEGDSKRKTQLKCALTLNKLLNDNKSRSFLNIQAGTEDLSLVDNLSKLSSATGLRAATISSIFNADSIPSITNVILILMKLQKTLAEFAINYELLEDSEIEIFESELSKKKIFEKNRRT